MTKEFIISKELLAHILNKPNHFVLHLPDNRLKEQEKLPTRYVSYNNKLKEPPKYYNVVGVHSSALFKYKDLSAPIFKMDHIMNSSLKCI